MEKEFYLPTPNLNPQGGSVPAFPSLLVASIPSPLVGVSDRFPPLLWGRVRVGGARSSYPPPRPSPTRGKGEEDTVLPHKGGRKRHRPHPPRGEEKTQTSPTRGEGGKDTDLTHKGGKEKKTQTSPNSGEGMGLLILIFQQNSSAFLKDLQPFAKF